MDPAIAAPYLLHLLGSSAESERLAGLTPEEYQASTLAVLVQWSPEQSTVPARHRGRRSPLDRRHLGSLAGGTGGAAGRARILLLVTFRPGYHPPGWASPMPRRWRCHG